MTRGEGTGRILLGHVEPPEELDPEVGVDHVVHVVSVGGHGARGTQLAVELDTVLAQDVARYPHLRNYTSVVGQNNETKTPYLPPVARLDHDVIVPPSLLQAAGVLIPAVALLSVPVILQQDHDVALRQVHVSVIEVLGYCMSRHSSFEYSLKTLAKR